MCFHGNPSPCTRDTRIAILTSYPCLENGRRILSPGCKAVQCTYQCEQIFPFVSAPMKGVRSFILSSFQYTNIIPLIAEDILSLHHTTHSRAIASPTQHGLPTATRHALLAATTAHAQPARHATTSTVHVRNPSTTSPVSTKRSSTPNAN